MNQTPSDQTPTDSDSSASAAPAATDAIKFAQAHRIAFIQSSHHREVVEACRLAFLDEAAAHGIAQNNVTTFTVPGAYEIPLHAQLLAKTGRFTAIVATALVIDSGVYRHANVANAVVDALMRVQLQTEVPIFSAVLTPLQFHEDGTQVDFYRESFALKGREVAQACLRTLSSLDFLGNQVVAGME
jgi:6,7-dimethyl-8-ribityllumazine synthase